MGFDSRRRVRHKRFRSCVTRLELMQLEHRLAPGQAGWGDALSLSLAGPVWEAMQINSAVTGSKSAVVNRARHLVTDSDVQLRLTALGRLGDLYSSFQAPRTTGIDGDPFVPPALQRPGDSGSRNTIVGPNIQTNNTFQCSATTGRIQSETAIAHSGNTVVVGYNDFRGIYCPGQGYQTTGWAYSTDRGRTFTDGGALPGGSSLGGDPWLTTGPDGTIYLASLWNPLSGLAVLRGTPTGNGVSWSSPTIINGAGPDKEALAVDPNNGNLYLTFTRFSGGSGIWMYKSTDGGVSFGSPMVVSSAGGLQGSAPAVGPNGEVYVSWSIGYPNETGLGFARSVDGGQTFQVTPVIATVGKFTVPGTDRAPHNPHIAVDLSGGPNHGDIYITYQTNHLGGGTGGDAVIIRSTNGGMNWSSASRINDDGTSALQWFPTINVDGFGNLHSFFYDRRGQGGNMTNLFYARSTNGGLTWEPNVNATSQAFNMTTFSEGSPAWGDYINADVQGKSAMVAYADGRNGTPDAFFTRVGNRD